jgi:hypothetical protein
MMKNTAVIILFLVVVNFTIAWFGSMGFFTVGPSGIEPDDPDKKVYDESKFSFAPLLSGDNIAAAGFLFVGLALVGYVASVFLRINAFAMIMFTNIFWLPYLNTVSILWGFLVGAPAAFLGIASIFSTIMLFIFAYALIEMSKVGGY